MYKHNEEAALRLPEEPSSGGQERHLLHFPKQPIYDNNTNNIKPSVMAMGFAPSGLHFANFPKVPLTASSPAHGHFQIHCIIMLLCLIVPTLKQLDNTRHHYLILLRASGAVLPLISAPVIYSREKSTSRCKGRAQLWSRQPSHDLGASLPARQPPYWFD